MNPPKKLYVLKLYIDGNTSKSVKALATLKSILEQEFRGLYTLKVIDIAKNPQLAEQDKIAATPTLTKVLPLPMRRIIGDFSDREKVLNELDLLSTHLNGNEIL